MEKFDIQVVGRTVTAAVVVGLAWAVDHQSAVITAVAMLMVWFVNALAKWRGIQIGRAWLTGFLYVVSMLLAVLFKWQALPAAPVWGGDPALYAEAMINYGSALIALSTVYVGGATAIYNMLMKQVFDKLTLVPIGK